MKKITKKLKGKKVLSLVLAAIMLATTFNMALPMLKLDVEAADPPNIGGITQERVVSDYATKYAQYAKDFLTTAEGISCGEPTDIVIPGLRAADDFIVQGLSYYPVKDWIMVSVYHKTAAKPSMIFALSAKTGVFEGAFAIYNKAGISSPNYDHGGGLAFSEYNFYYSGDDSDKEDGDDDGNADQIAYAPLSYFNNPVDSNGDGFYEVFLQGAIDLPELNNAPTAYVCYDEGILWAGNFYSDGLGAGDYSSNVIPVFTDAKGNEIGNTMIYGYKLAGNSSQEEWDYLCGKFRNLLEIAKASGSAEANGSKCTWNAYINEDSVNVYGNITKPTATVGEFTGHFGKAHLIEGTAYTIEFISTNINTDMYVRKGSETGPHCNVKQATNTVITKLQDGRYHYKMNFTAGLRPAGADSNWPTTQSTDGSYTADYYIRFDQDAISANEERSFEITDVRIYQTNPDEKERVFNVGSAGYPSYCIAVDCDFEDIQYAIVDKGRVYLSRSWGTGTNNEWFATTVIGGLATLDDYSTLTIGDIDLSVPGDVEITHNTGDAKGTRTTKAYLLTHENSTSYDLMPMSEGLCFIEDNLYISFEGASNKYMNEYSIKRDDLFGTITNTGNCDYPIDVVWKVDPYALRSEKRPNTDKTDYYEKITSLSQIQSGDEFIIVHESEEKDPVSQMPILYAFDADGGFKDYNLAKSVSGSVKGYDGMVCHPLTKYSRNGNRIYLTEPETDDLESIRWKLDKVSGNNYNIENTELYFSTYKNLYFDANTISMMTDNTTELAKIRIHEVGNGGFKFEGNGNYLWCNDSLTNNYTPKINRHYAENGGAHPMYSGLSEEKGTVHCNALFNGNSNIIDGSVGTDADSVFHIYKRVLDQYAEQQESRVFTDMSAVVEKDGTYTVNLETYAISSSQYKMLDERATDFIIVMDTSSSMETQDTGVTGWQRWSSLNPLSLKNAAGTENAAKEYDKEFSGNIYYRHTDGQYCKLKCMTHYVDKSWGTTYIKVKLWYTANGQNYYLMSNGSIQTTEPSWDSCVEISGANVPGRAGKTIYTGPHYTYAELSRLNAMKLSVESLIDKISAEAAVSGLKHRVAIVQYGCNNNSKYYDGAWAYYNTGMFTKDYAYHQYETITSSNYSSNPFFKVYDANVVKDLKLKVMEGIESPGDRDADTFSNLGFEIAKNIITNSDADYSAIGNRSVCVLMITDGIPGKGGTGSDSVTVATNTANSAITQAKAIKDAGGYVFTAQLGSNSLSGFDMDKYMDYTSSEYVNAISLDNSGDRNIKDIEYRKDFALGGNFNLTNFVSTMFDAIQANSRFALVQLDDESIIQQKLSSLFDATTAETPKAVVQDGYYDKIGRLTFDNEQTDTNIKSNMSADTITVSGFDYSTEYISKEKPGKKLIVTVKGLIPKPDVDFVNESINNHTYTAIYQKAEDAGATSSERDLAFKHFPTEYFNIPEYTYALDYGLSLLDTDINGTLCSVSDTLKVQKNTAGELDYKNSALNGDLAIQDGGKALLYSIDPGVTGKSGYTLINRPDGTYDWFKIKIVPASNIYFEENEITVEEENDSTISKWETADGGTSATNRLLPSEEDPFGFDNAYNNTNAYSNGTALKTVVDETKESSEISTFTFTGTGFDLVSACGPKTGVLAVSVKSGGKRVKSFMVDTYYDGSDKATLNQVPVISWSNGTSEAKTYEVSVMAIYLGNAGAVPRSGIKNNMIDTGLTINSAKPTDTKDAAKLLESVGAEEFISDDIEMVWFDDNSIFNGGTGVAPTKKQTRETTSTTETTVTLENYIDGFRVYNPLGADTSAYKDAEQKVSYVNVVKNLSKLSSESSTFGEIAYITSSLTEGTSLTFAKYQEVGPKDELYLKKDGGISFKVKVSGNEKVMLGLRAVNGETNVTINGGKPMSVTIKSATEMYYDISECITTTGEVTISVTNNGPKLIAVNHIKFSGGEQINTTTVSGVRSTTRSTDASAVEASKFLPVTQDDLVAIENSLNGEVIPAMVRNGVVVPIVEEEEIIPDDNTNTGDNNINDDTDTEESENEEFSLFSLIEMLIAFIEKILYNAFGAGSIA